MAVHKTLCSSRRCEGECMGFQREEDYDEIKSLQAEIERLKKLNLKLSKEAYEWLLLCCDKDDEIKRLTARA